VADGAAVPAVADACGDFSQPSQPTKKAAKSNPTDRNPFIA
jgi:hypothetical protein